MNDKSVPGSWRSTSASGSEAASGALIYASEITPIAAGRRAEAWVRIQHQVVEDQKDGFDAIQQEPPLAPSHNSTISRCQEIMCLCRNRRIQVAWEYVTDYGSLWRGVAATLAGSSKPSKLSFIGLPGLASNSPPRLAVNSCCSVLMSGPLSGGCHGYGFSRFFPELIQKTLYKDVAERDENAYKRRDSQCLLALL